MTLRYGATATPQLRTVRGFIRPALLQAGALHLRTATVRAKKLLEKCLRERKQILYMKSKFMETFKLITMLQLRLKRIMNNKRYQEKLVQNAVIEAWQLMKAKFEVHSKAF